MLRKFLPLTLILPLLGCSIPNPFTSDRVFVKHASAEQDLVEKQGKVKPDLVENQTLSDPTSPEKVDEQAHA